MKHAKVLGIRIEQHLNWENHVELIASKISEIGAEIGAIRKLKEFLNRDTLVSVYNSLIQPHFDYCCEVWDTLGQGLRDRLQKLQNRAARLIMNFKNEHSQSILACNSLGWISLQERRAQMKARLVSKTVNGLTPQN